MIIRKLTENEILVNQDFQEEKGYSKFSDGICQHSWFSPVLAYLLDDEVAKQLPYWNGDHIYNL